MIKVLCWWVGRILMIIGIISLKVERCKQVGSKWDLVGIILVRTENANWLVTGEWRLVLSVREKNVRYIEKRKLRGYNKENF